MNTKNTISLDLNALDAQIEKRAQEPDIPNLPVGTTIDLSKLEKMHQELQHLLMEEKELKAKKKRITDRFKDLMPKGTTGLIHGTEVAFWKESASRAVDYKLLEEEYPEIYMQVVSIRKSNSLKFT